MSRFVHVVHETAPTKAFRVPEHWLGNPSLGAGLTRVSLAELERDKTVVEPGADDAPPAPKTGRKATTKE